MRRRRNPSDSNPYGIDDRVWSRIVGSETPTIDKIMFAASLDPLLIHELDDIQPPRSFVECVQLADMGTRGDLRGYLKGVLIKWVMSSSDRVSRVVHEIASWDIRLGVWCAAACAESVLRFVPKGEDRPRLAVEAAKGWVLGLIDEAAVRAAAADAADAAYAARYAANVAAYAAAYAARYAAFAAYAASAAAADAADVAERAAAYAAYVASAVRNVIARGIETYPVEQP